MYIFFGLEKSKKEQKLLKNNINVKWKKKKELESEHFAFKLLIELIEYFYLFSSWILFINGY